jgi:hypothetical protein
MTKIVSINIYELHPKANRFLSKIGIGLYHSGVVIDNREWTFGPFINNQTNENGIYSIPPGLFNEFHKTTIIIGQIDINEFDLTCIVNKFRQQFLSSEYELIINNCNDFTKVFCREICNYDVPNWINRAAKISSIFYCPSCCKTADVLDENYTNLLSESRSSSSPHSPHSPHSSVIL